MLKVRTNVNTSCLSLVCLFVFVFHFFFRFEIKNVYVTTDNYGFFRGRINNFHKAIGQQHASKCDSEMPFRQHNMLRHLKHLGKSISTL